MKRSIQIAVLLFFSLMACRQKEVPPTVYLPAPVPDISTADTLAFEFSATDDHQLASMGYRLVPVFDSIPGTQPSWRNSRIFTTELNTDFRGDTLMVPDSISIGNYRLTVFAADKEGFSDTLRQQFRVSSKVDSIPPKVDTIIRADTISLGNVLKVEFSIADDQQLVYADYRLVSLVNDSTLLGKSSTISGNTFVDSLKLMNVGDLQQVRFRLLFYDWVNNKASAASDIYIKE